MITLAAAAAVTFTACGDLMTVPAESPQTAASEADAAVQPAESTAGTVYASTGSVVTLPEQTAADAEYSASEGGLLAGADMFTKRDLKQSPDVSEAKYLSVSDGKTIDITEDGVYVISGSAKDCTIRVEAPDDAKVQLVLNGVTVENGDFPAVYVVSADKVFVTSIGENSLSVTGKFSSDGDTNTDAVVFSKDDITFNGSGSLTVTSAYGNGVSGKDDVKFTGGTYDIRSALDGIEANDSIRICGGEISVKSGKDGLHAENDEDDSLGYVYIAGGTLNIDADDDGIHATTVIQIDGGEIAVGAYEGLEATYIQINGGKIDIDAVDDGINAARKSGSYRPTFEMNDGELTVAVGQGDTDAIDSNGDIIVNGGRIDITSTVSSFDYDGSAVYNGGTIVINGQQVDSIPQSMMGGRGGRGFGGGFGGNAGGNGGGNAAPPDGGFPGGDLPDGDFPGVPGVPGDPGNAGGPGGPGGGFPGGGFGGIAG